VRVQRILSENKIVMPLHYHLRNPDVTLLFVGCVV